MKVRLSPINMKYDSQPQSLHLMTKGISISVMINSINSHIIKWGLQQFGVIPFEIRTLRKGHTEQRRTRRFYITAIVRHRGTVGAWRNRGYLRVL